MGGRRRPGYGEPIVDQELDDLGLARVAIPRRGRAGPARQLIERQRGFRRLVKWRTGREGRISCLKHRFGWDRIRMDGIDGARIWCGHGVFAHNLAKLRGATGRQAPQGSMSTQGTSLSEHNHPSQEADRLITKCYSGPSN
jgi:IS5 family transposase